MTTQFVRWCRWCDDVATWQGSHLDNGDFDPRSVFVTEDEIDKSMIQAMSFYGTRYERAEARWNIAFGKHIGTRA